jgi:hypothetical protein
MTLSMRETSRRKGAPRAGNRARHSVHEEDEIPMYIVAIGWLYVALMMAITEHTVVAAIATFLLYGVGPVALLLYILGTPGRRKRRRAAEQAAEQAAGQATEQAEEVAQPAAQQAAQRPAKPAPATPPDGGAS